MFRMISYKEAKQMMDEQENLIVLDVRSEEEYNNGHIPNAKLLALDSVEEKAKHQLPQKEQTILIYCRSGVRSKIAARILAQQGYSNLFEFGGILDWPYEIVGE